MKLDSRVLTFFFPAHPDMWTDEGLLVKDSDKEKEEEEAAKVALDEALASQGRGGGIYSQAHRDAFCTMAAVAARRRERKVYTHTHTHTHTHIRVYTGMLGFGAETCGGVALLCVCVRVCAYLSIYLSIYIYIYIYIYIERERERERERDR